MLKSSLKCLPHGTVQPGELFLKPMEWSECPPSCPSEVQQDSLRTWRPLGHTAGAPDSHSGGRQALCLRFAALLTRYRQLHTQPERLPGRKCRFRGRGVLADGQAWAQVASGEERPPERSCRCRDAAAPVVPVSDAGDSRFCAHTRVRRDAHPLLLPG